MFYSSIVVFIENSTFSKAIQEKRERERKREREKKTHTHRIYKNKYNPKIHFKIKIWNEKLKTDFTLSIFSYNWLLVGLCSR